MSSPFLFGKTVSTKNFTNRRKEVKRLVGNFNNGINTILISPRRWGKSSLVQKVAEKSSSSLLKVVQLDLFSIRNEEEFYKALATSVIKATSGKLEGWLETVKNFLQNIIPKISVGVDPLQDFEISFEYKELDKYFRDILDLAENVCREKKIKMVICIDEFQNCAAFKDHLLFQKRLRSAWQHHRRVSYCLYGSRQHMMAELFEKQSMPFYRFGEVMYLPKIEREDWINYIEEQFTSTKKKISSKQAGMIAALVQDHSYYVQQLSHLVWIGTEKTVTTSVIQSGLNDILDQNALLYSRDTEDIASSQLNYLKAVASGIITGLSAAAVLREYNLGTSANVLKIRKTLIQKELIDYAGGKVSFLDPVYELWFRKNILGKDVLTEMFKELKNDEKNSVNK